VSKVNERDYLRGSRLRRKDDSETCFERTENMVEK
jgi:hypothetical protein